jgi:hypothetical protein
MEPMSYMLSVVDQNVIMQHVPVLKTRNILREAISKENLLVSLILVLFIITAETLWIE